MSCFKKDNPSCATCSVRTDTIFSAFTKAEFDLLDNNKTYRSFKKGERVFSEGSEPKGLFCIFDGSVKITKIDEEGNEQIVRLAKYGNIIGYRALLCNDKYRASAIALEDVHICFFPKELYFQLLQSKPEMATETIKKLTTDLRFAENMMMNIAKKHVKGRIAEILLILEDFYGIYEKDQTINMTLKREDIGHLVGTTTETSIRVISEMKKEGLIDLIGKRVKILNREKIRALSNHS